jgi:catechol 2,3-dioxygenase-like lactoylglutathione lyase family enzyme
MKYLALPVSDQVRSYEMYLGFDALPARRYEDGVLMLYNDDGFSLALGATDTRISVPEFLHFGISLTGPDAVRALRDRLGTEGVAIVEEWDEPEYVSVKFRDPDGYVVEAFWEAHLQ